ncbi:MAG: Rrf2 family transcriptional regulator [Candidatus Humimicrobiaceae bacterium]
MKLITRDIDYAIRALSYIATNNSGEAVTVTRLVKETKIPKPFLRKILQILGKEGLLKSFKGKSGGFKLNRDPKDILLLDLVEIFQEKFEFNKCMFKKKICPNTEKCVLKDKLDRIGKMVEKEFAKITLESIIKGR